MFTEILFIYLCCSNNLNAKNPKIMCLSKIHDKTKNLCTSAELTFKTFI